MNQPDNTPLLRAQTPGATVKIAPLTPHHARQAAQLHIAGQPGTFLTSLGPEVLTIFYAALPSSPVGFGYVIPTALGEEIAGFVSATTSTGRLFAELGLRHLGRFLPPLLRRFARQPQLAWRSAQTLLYPLAAGGHGEQTGAPTAELLSIMVEPAQRSHGLGAQLLDALCLECERRSIVQIDVTVDATNAGARRFYARHEFVEMRPFQLYGRAMCSYRRTLTGGRAR
ncbi:MAG: GNAT family N-acetyltransferase [Caldilineaceae bacterium]|nr:GNAT family N-acetyltransferase [Caldilineaceae bacterium]